MSSRAFDRLLAFAIAAVLHHSSLLAAASRLGVERRASYRRQPARGPRRLGARPGPRKPQHTAQCPAGSQVFTLAAKPEQPAATPRLPFTRVTLADYPSTGSTWLHALLRAIARKSACADPVCSVYGEDPCEIADAWCPCEWNVGQGARLTKSHFPAQEIWAHKNISSEQMRRSMFFDKLIHLVRDPVATVRSNIRRWHGLVRDQAENLRCWGEWWERVKSELDSENVHVLRYESLCIHTAHELHRVLRFLGGCYAGITLKSVEQTLASDRKLRCIHAADVNLHRPGSDVSKILREVGHLYSAWGYEEDERGSALLQQADSLGDARGENFSGSVNPWI